MVVKRFRKGQNDPGTGAPFQQRKAKEPGIFQCRERILSSDLIKVACNYAGVENVYSENFLSCIILNELDAQQMQDI